MDVPVFPRLWITHLGVLLGHQPSARSRLPLGERTYFHKAVIVNATMPYKIPFATADITNSTRPVMFPSASISRTAVGQTQRMILTSAFDVPAPSEW